ncbi:hypothetical protein BDW71DRAFT_130198 [Aspergillus fruticulosus]
MARPNQRHACDRCHGQKLRCIHTASGPCLRCTKAKATCSWSQSLRSNRPKKQDTSTQHTDENAQFSSNPAWAVPTGRYPSPTSQESDSHDLAQTEAGVEATVDWMWPTVTDGSFQSAAPENWQQAFDQEWAMMASQHAASVTETSPGLPASDGLDSPQTTCIFAMISELSQLNIDLYAHQTSVPIPPASLADPLTWKNKDFAIDRTFELSQRLIKLVNKKYPRYRETARMQTPESALDSTMPEPQIDQGSCLLILSCYTRLIETYGRIFANMQGCLDRSSVTAPEDYVSMPSVQIGSFSLPHSSSLQIVLILQLARELLTRMSEVIKIAKPEKQMDHRETSAPEPAGGSQLLSSALNDVAAEEDRLMNKINKLRSTLITLNIL